MDSRLRGFGWATSAVTLLLVASGGGDGNAAPVTTEQDGVTTEQPDQQTTEETTAPSVGCEEPPPIEIILETPITSEIEGQDRCFTVEVPAGSATLTIELTGLTGSLDLFVGYDDPETIQFGTGDFWRSSESDTADELVTIENPISGTYYINVAVATFRDFSSFTLSASTS